ncbi:helix-turn-helix domain-containing protein [Sinorhizobium meliloti]|nr:helix-turn-helix domain-containing protein [Sinorhizobium meliloti]
MNYTAIGAMRRSRADESKPEPPKRREADRGGRAMEFPTGYYTLKQVCELLTLSKSTIYWMRRRKEFVEAVDLTSGRIGFPIPEVHAWKLKREESRGGPRKQRGLIRCRPIQAWKLKRDNALGEPRRQRGSSKAGLPTPGR